MVPDIRPTAKSYVRHVLSTGTLLGRQTTTTCASCLLVLAHAAQIGFQLPPRALPDFSPSEEAPGTSNPRRRDLPRGAWHALGLLTV